MRKLYLFLLSSVLFTFCYGQSPVYKITQNYFRSDPFRNEFSSFLTHLLNDPTLNYKTTMKKTDTSLFYFEGTYTNHNPFFFQPTKVEVILTEMPVDMDSVTRDTIFTYQLIALNNDTKKGTEELKKEFDKIFKKYKSSFSKNTYTENSADSKLQGATYNFFDAYHAIAPFALTWFGPNENKEMGLILTVRMSTRNNQAILPIPFYGF